MQRQMLPMSIPEKLGIVCSQGNSTYFARLSIRIPVDKVVKLEELLQRWHADSIQFTKLILPTYYHVTFFINNNRKIFTFKKAVENYGGKVFFTRFNKLQSSMNNLHKNEDSLQNHRPVSSTPFCHNHQEPLNQIG